MTSIILATLVVLLSAPGSDSPDSLLPSEGGTVRRWHVNGPPYEYAIWPDWVEYGFSYSTFPPAGSWWHGWLRFDLSGFPDSARFDEARLLFNQYNDSMSPACRLTGFVSPGSDTEAFYHLVDTCMAVSDSVNPVRGWNSLELNAAGLALLDSCLAGDRVYLGIRHEGGSSFGEIKGLDQPDSLWPRLALTWHTGVSEPGQPRTPARTLAIWPNPARTRAHVVLPEPVSGTLAVLDISGREVWTKCLAGERSGTLQLPALPAGVYLVRLQSSAFTATKKLVVQR